jgi:hypothetical protein
LNVLFNLIFFMKEPEREKKESERDEWVSTNFDRWAFEISLLCSLILSQTVSSYRNKCSNSQHLLHTCCGDPEAIWPLSTSLNGQLFMIQLYDTITIFIILKSGISGDSTC